MARATPTVDELITQLRQVHGDTLQAVVLYGSAATDEHVAGRSDLNLLVIVQRVELASLRQLAQTMRAWQEAGNPPVLELTRAEWERSADIFPIEYADILERHRVLYGTLPMTGIAVHLHELRLQTEHEAMGKLLRLRRGVMVAGTDATRQRELLQASLSALLVIFRAVLRLHGEKPPRDGLQVIERVAARCAFAAEPFSRVYALVRGTTLSDRDTETVLAGYVEGMVALVTYLDQFTPPADAAGALSPDPS